MHGDHQLDLVSEDQLGGDPYCLGGVTFGIDNLGLVGNLLAVLFDEDLPPKPLPTVGET